MTRRYIPATHDPIVTEMNTKWRRTDQEIADEMGFSKDTITPNRVRLGLPMYSRPKMPLAPRQHEPAPPKEKPNPLTVAAYWLGKRLIEKRGTYWLDNAPAGLDAIMRATNEVIKAKGNGEIQVGYNSRWLV